MKSTVLCLSLLFAITFSVLAKDTEGAENSITDKAHAEGTLESDASVENNTPQATDVETVDAEGGQSSDASSDTASDDAAVRTEISETEEAATTTETGAAAKDDAPNAEQAGGLSAEALAKANNPLADLTALNFHNYYLPEAETTTSFIRFAKPLFKGRLLVRMTLPIHTMPHPTQSDTMAGIGDLNIFAAVNIISKPTTTFGIGPLGNFSTTVGTNDLRETVGAKNALGGAMVVFKAISPVVAVGGLVTYHHTLGDKPDLRDQNLMVAQPFTMIQAGKGVYVRSAAMWSFDFENDFYTIPFGLGIGKVIKAGKVVVNGFLEPTFTIFSNNPNQPLFQLFTGLNLQFIGRK